MLSFKFASVFIRRIMIYNHSGFDVKRTYLIDVKRSFLTLAGVLWTMSICTYTSSDPGVFQLVSLKPTVNSIGVLGAYLADGTLSIFGYVGFLLPFLLLTSTWKSPQVTDKHFQSLGWFLLIFTLATSAALFATPGYFTPAGSGGLIGAYSVWPMLQVLGFYGTVLTLTIFLFVALLMIFQISISELLPNIRTKEKAASIKQRPEDTMIKHFLSQQSKKEDLPKPVKTKRITKVEKIDEKVEIVQKNMDYQIALGLLQKAVKAKSQFTKDQLNALSEMVEKKLKDFGISVNVQDVFPGPVITRFELTLAAGTKVSRLSSIATDLARSLSVDRARVVEVIPGKSVVGLELPNPSRDTVFLSEILGSDVYSKSSSPLSLALGKDIAGYPVVVDLMKMPHLLVAGTTGSGKSVGLNTMLVSMLYKSPPDILKLIMIDPKMLELAVYADIPHLLTPVVTDMNDAAASLRWCVAEMERRYQVMVAAGVRNIAGFNQKVQQAIAEGKTLSELCKAQNSELLDKMPLEPMPYIVVVADEFADMMMVVGKKVEQLIARLAQKARAAGIHLILATQRPSVDVITGLIKANIPTRIAFQVTSKIDSRTILDQGGAEQLLGYGDMLYQPPGTSIPMRIHGAFVTDDEVHSIVSACKKYGDPKYVIMANESDISQSSSGEPQDKDELFDEAVEWVRDTGKVSVSSLQRRFRIGYNRSSCIVEAMESEGIVSGPEPGGARKVLVKND